MTDNKNWVEDRLRADSGALVIDGGTGTHLQKSGVPMDDNVWSSRAVLSHPDVVRETHEAFITAGAQVIIANTFAAGRHMLEPGGFGGYVKEINLNAVKLAQQARDNVANEPIAVAGSICEWVPSNDSKWNSPEAIGRSVKEQVAFLVDAGVDLIALEMCEQTEFSVAAIDAALESGLPIWVGVSAKTHNGSQTLSVFDYVERDFESLVKVLANYPAMMMNVMHTPIPDVYKALKILRRYWRGPVGVYPESGYFTMPNWQFVDVVEPDELARISRGWVENGVRMVGGCCGIGPKHIAALRHEFTYNDG